MKWSNRLLIVLLSVVTLEVLADHSAQAKPGHGRFSRDATVEIDIAGEVESEPNLVTLTPENQQLLINAILGTGEYSHLIDDNLRNEILANRYTLPPGIQRQLVRRHRLPPGIAKKLYLPSTIHPIVGLPVGTQLLVIGPNIVTIDTATDTVLDILEQAL